MSETLEILFGSRAKTRLIRFFMLNSESEYSFMEVVKRNMITTQQAKKELKDLVKIKFLIEKNKKSGKDYQLNDKFHFYAELKSLFAKSSTYPQSKNLNKIKNIGDVRLMLTSGVFINYPKSKADMILVVNNVSRSKLKSFMNSLEAEMGREVSFVLMNSEELKYRLDMLDRFLLDFLEAPHEEVVNKVPGLKRFIAGLRKY